MKPHEETWRGAGGYVEDMESGRIRAKVGDNNPERVALIAAAPEMARALLSLGGPRRVTAMDEWHLTPCVRRHAGESCDEECEAVRAVLTKAGVLP